MGSRNESDMSSTPANAPPSKSALRVSELNQNAVIPFALRPDSREMHGIADELGLSALRKLSFEGKVRASGAQDWELTGRLGATVVQPCVVTLEPVTTRIDADVTRVFMAQPDLPDDEVEAEMPDDETVEALGKWIDPAQVMREALALEAPDYPRKEDASLGKMVYTKPDEAPMTDEDARPFAGLAALKDQLNKE